MKEAVQRKLESWLEEKEEIFVKDIASLVQIPSIAEKKSRKGAPYGENCRTVLEVMQKIARREKVETDDVDGYCLRLTAGEGETEIGIWNHLDVVPAGDGWQYPPFVCTEKNGYLIGRGVQDNKGPALAVFYALMYLKEEGELTHIRAEQILGCEEECGMGDVEYYLRKKKAPAYSFVADCGFPVCCGEKGILRLTLESGELELLREVSGGIAPNSIPSEAKAILGDSGNLIKAEGISGHAAFPDGSLNAIGVLAGKLLEKELPERDRKVVEFLRAAGDTGYGEGLSIACEDEVSGKLTCNLGLVRQNGKKLTIDLDIRYPVMVKSETFLTGLLKRAEEAGFQEVCRSDSAPYYMNPDTPFVRVLHRAWEEETGLTGNPFVMGGGTYARKIPRAVAFGPGSSRDYGIPGLKKGHGNCHCADEAEAKENIRTAVKVYVRALRALDQLFA
ncbi:MAG: M20/M25/M40 family metallo-hydrolase [Candidatus Limivivens sp.]|nr:M20/M25/M40 family metallo-hydrolase [Candidatus Limivivens sp.]